ncbi:MAG: hypothetical protein NWF05_08360 [Candidatus Bathyarchaeota archaeon]|nr:hypothetical protein [Candidatus Bathyarchaeota archaeon]
MSTLEMKAAARTSALNCTLNDLRKACPEVQNAFIFKAKQVLACDTETDQTAAYDAMQAVRAVDRRATCSGGLESITFTGSKGQASVIRTSDFYLATITNNPAETPVLNALTHVMVPTVLKVLDIIQPEFVVEKDFGFPAAEKTEDLMGALANSVQVDGGLKPDEEMQRPPQVPFAPVLPDVPVSQFMVENLSGFKMLMGSQDAVRVESGVIARWSKLFGDRQIVEVAVEETRTGKRMRCRFKPIKDQKFEGKGVIQLPEKVQAFLQTQKGALVVVKPVIEQPT